MAIIRVTAGAGRQTPIPSSLCSTPAGALMVLVPGEELDIDDAHPYTQRALRNGDLVRVNAKPTSASAKKE